MANVVVREYADVAVTFSRSAQVGAEPAIASQNITSSGASAQSAAFNANTRLVAISCATPVAVEFGLAGASPTALVTTSLRVPSNSIAYFGVRPGMKVAVIDVT